MSTVTSLLNGPKVEVFSIEVVGKTYRAARRVDTQEWIVDRVTHRLHGDTRHPLKAGSPAHAFIVRLVNEHLAKEAQS